MDEPAKLDEPVPPQDWEWFGNALHFICADRCRFHLATKVGGWIVSTVGEYIPTMKIQQQGEQARDPEEIGVDRLYETMVFKSADCKCGGEFCEGTRIVSGSEKDYAPANTAKEARDNHLMLCRKWAGFDATFHALAELTEGEE